MTTSKMNNCTFYYFSFQGYYFYPDYFVAMNHRQNLCHFKPTE